MKLHWSLSNLIVLTIVTSMLGTVQFALAKVHPPFRCWDCCPDGPLCDQDTSRLEFRRMAGTALVYGNQIAATWAMPTSAQLYDLAKRVRAWQNEADANGDMTALYWYVRNNQATIEAKTFDTSAFVPGIRSMGSTAVQWQLDYALAGMTQTLRIQFVDHVLSSGFDWEVDNGINQIRALAAMVEYAEKHPGHFPPVRPFCITTMSIMIVWGEIAAVALFTGDEPVAAVTGLVAASAGMLYGIGGCI